MSFSLLSLCWVRRNAAKTPAKLKLEREELEALISSKKIKKTKKKSKKQKTEPQSNKDNDTEINAKYNLDDYDDEGLSSVVLFTRRQTN